MKDPTEVGTCEECGAVDYLVLWHHRKLCHSCAIMLTKPVSAGERPMARDLADDPYAEEDAAVTTPPHETELQNRHAFVLALFLFTTGAGLIAHQMQEGQIALLRQSVDTLQARLVSIEAKLDRVLDAQRERSATAGLP